MVKTTKIEKKSFCTYEFDCPSATYVFKRHGRYTGLLHLLYKYPISELQIKLSNAKIHFFIFDNSSPSSCCIFILNASVYIQLILIKQWFSAPAYADNCGAKAMQNFEIYNFILISDFEKMTGKW